jgi:hypothetical protein
VAISYPELTRRIDCLQRNSSARTPRKTPSSSVKDACSQLCCLAIDVLLFRKFALGRPYGKHSLHYIVVTFLRGVFTSRRIETTVLLLMPVFVAVKMFTDIPLLLRNLATDCLPRICLRGNLFTNPLPSNSFTCNTTFLRTPTHVT